MMMFGMISTIMLLLVAALFLLVHYGVHINVTTVTALTTASSSSLSSSPLSSSLAGAASSSSSLLLSASSSSSSSSSSSKPKLLQPFGKPAATHTDTLNRNIVRAEGVRVWDDQGREYLDGIGSLWYCQIGYGRSVMIDAITEQLTTGNIYNQYPPFASTLAEDCAARIVSLSPMRQPAGRAYLCTSGSEAVDTAIKLARAVAQLNGEHDRQIIVRRSRAFHGTNIGGTSTQGIAANRQGWGDLLPHVIEIEADSLESAEAIFAQHGNKIAAVITEPIQAAAGVFLPPDGYLDGLRTLCTQHGALLIFDEVITGFGRTGQWFASETYNVVPDLLTFAKGATSGYQPLGGVVLSRAVCDVLEADPDYVFRHGHTYSGFSGSCAACLKNIDIIEQEGLVDRANEIGARLVSGLEKLLATKTIREIRGVGAIYAVRLNNDDLATTVAIRDRMLDLGVIIRPLYDSIAFCPPLIMTDHEVDTMVKVLAQAIHEVTAVAAGAATTVSSSLPEEDIEWGVSYIGGDPCGSKYNTDPFDASSSAASSKPGLPDSMKARIQLKADKLRERDQKLKAEQSHPID